MTWNSDFPAARPPHGLRHVEVRAEWDGNDKKVPCRVYEWWVILAELDGNGRWHPCTGRCHCYVPLDAVVPVYAVVFGPWTSGLDARAWTRWNERRPLKWMPFTPPEGP